MGRLTAVAVKNAGPGRHGDGGGLYLIVKSSGAKSWMLRVQFCGQRRDIGLGSVAVVGLAEARERAAELRKHALNGRDPITERDRDKRPIPTFREAIERTHAALKGGWSSKNAASFLTSLRANAVPKLGNMRVDSIEASDIIDALAPIWLIKPQLARKVRIRIAQTLNYSHARGWRRTEAPSRSVSLALPKQPMGRNFKAMPYADVPRFFAELRASPPTVGRLALLFQILTAARPGEVRAARWGQFDLGRGLWERPAAMMKMARPHSVTLSAHACELLRELESNVDHESDAVVFPGRAERPMSDMTLKKVLSDAGYAFDPHGFRSSFRDWAAEQRPDIPDPVAEAALAHIVPEAVVRAYKRTEFVDLRRQLLDAWSAYVWGAEAAE